MKYWCDNCNEVFDEDDVQIRDIYEYMDGRRYLFGREVNCPKCGEELNLEEANTCQICGEYISPHEQLCDECKEDLDILIEQKMDEIVLDTGISKDELIEQLDRWLSERGM